MVCSVLGGSPVLVNSFFQRFISCFPARHMCRAVSPVSGHPAHRNIWPRSPIVRLCYYLCVEDFLCICPFARFSLSLSFSFSLSLSLHLFSSFFLFLSLPFSLSLFSPSTGLCLSLSLSLSNPFLFLLFSLFSILSFLSSLPISLLPFRLLVPYLPLPFSPCISGQFLSLAVFRFSPYFPCLALAFYAPFASLCVRCGRVHSYRVSLSFRRVADV